VHDSIGAWVSAELPPERLATTLDARRWLGRVWYGLAGALGIAVMWLILRRLRWTPRIGNSRKSPGQASDVAFYRRWLTLVSGECGLVPLPSQTPLEFAEDIGRAFQANASTARWSQVPGAVVRFFYRVRYGGRPLTALEQHAIDEQMDGVESTLRRK
jgi:hypothetical protein